MMEKAQWKKIIQVLVTFDYYLAALLLLIAGIIKTQTDGISGLMETLVERGDLTVDTMILIARYQPWVEIIVGLYALIGWRAEWTARGMALLYLFFSVVIYYVSEGYLTLPIDCGCFGESEGTPVYLLLLRNCSLAFPLFFFTSQYRRWTLFYRLKGNA